MKEGSGQGRQGGAGRTMGSAKPALAPVQVHFGGKLPLILLKAVSSVSILVAYLDQMIRVRISVRCAFGLALAPVTPGL